MRKRIAIIMAFLENNLGDDIFVQQLCARYPNADFYVATPKYKNTALESINNLYFSAEMKEKNADFGLESLPRATLRFFEKFDACVVIGGSIFMQPGPDFKTQILRFKNRVKLSRKLFVIGANFGPFSNSQYLKTYSDAFKGVEDICFRDTCSIAHFPNQKNIRYAPDVILGCDYQRKEIKKQIAMSVIDCSFHGRPQIQLAKLNACKAVYEEKLAEVAAAFSRRGYAIRVLSFCEAQGDAKVAEKIVSECRQNGVTDIEHVPYRGDITEMVNEIASSECMIATRFHAMILGWLFGMPTFPVVYDRKQKTVISDFGFDKGYCDLTEFGTMDVEAILQALDDYGIFDCKQQMCDAHEQFKALDQFLKG